MHRPINANTTHRPGGGGFSGPKSTGMLGRQKNDPQILVVNFAKPIPLLVVLFTKTTPLLVVIFIQRIPL